MILKVVLLFFLGTPGRAPVISCIGYGWTCMCTSWPAPPPMRPINNSNQPFSVGI
jgi:hypothetical protein